MLYKNRYRVPKNSRASVATSKMRSEGTGSRDCMDLVSLL